MVKSYTRHGLRIAVRITMLVLMIAGGGGFLSVTAEATDTISNWSFVTIPGLPDGAGIGKLWTDQPGNLYVWAENTTGSFLYHWNGVSWGHELNLPGFTMGRIFGTGPTDVFAKVFSSAQNKPVIYHYNGINWTEQTLPGELQGDIYDLAGEYGNVYATANTGSGLLTILRYNGTTWQIESIISNRYYSQIGYISQNEIYIMDCWGHSLWDGNTWTFYHGFDFCDVNDVWGMRDNTGQLTLYTEGNNNFANGIRVWRFNETYPGSKVGSWGSKYDGTVLSDPPGYGSSNTGTGWGIWGSSDIDIYVVGVRDQWTSGRVYYFNGTVWKNITEFGAIPSATAVWGSGSDDVWVALSDSRLLHYGTATDFIPPESITNLRNITYASNYINWTWTDSTDSDFSKVMIYLNGTFQTNVTNGTQYYNATSLALNTTYEISTHTVDTSGNINQTWKNQTAKTAPAASECTEYKFLNLSNYVNHDNMMVTVNYNSLPINIILYSKYTQTPFTRYTNGTNSLIMVGKYYAGIDQPNSVNIKFDDYASIIYFIGHAQVGEPSYEIVGRYTINYTDGTSLQIDLDNRPTSPDYNIDDHCCNWLNKNLTKAVLAWEDVTQYGNPLIREFKWNNPYPEKKINNIVFSAISITRAPMLFAITYSLPCFDNTPPASITNLVNISYAQTYINWTWTDPADIDFNHVEIYLDGIQKPNVLPGVRYYNETGLTASTTYEIGTRTVDNSGNVNATWKNHTAITAPSDTWTNMNPTTHPSARVAHDLAYDSASDRIILFGGINPDQSFDDTWAYDINTNIWSNLNPTTHPSARYGYAMAYDSESDRLILFGGWIGYSNDETWVYDFNTNTWTNLNPATHPSARAGSKMIYDVQSDRIILFGGHLYGGPDPSYDDTWAYDFNTNTWINMNPATHPSARNNHEMTYNVKSDTIILFGGVTPSANVLDDTWAYDFNTNTWTNMNSTIRPSARGLFAMTYDVRNDRIILFGGADINSVTSNDTWVYDFNINTWTNMNPATHPSARDYSSMAYDSASDRIILFGGSFGCCPDVFNNDTWSYYYTTMITGTVTNATDSSPIPGALVSLSNGQNNITIADGTYAINSVPLGSYFITTTASGYAPNITSINVTSGTNIKDIQLQKCRNIFSDIDCGYWGYMYIMTLYDHGVTSGYPDGTFKSENQITRSEVATFVVRAMGLEYTGGLIDFPDVPNTHWSYPYVMAAKQNGIISGYPDGTFKPDNQVTRSEISVMVTKARDWTYSGGLPDFPDVPNTHWSYPYVMAVKEKGIVGGYPDGTFKSDNQATRAENSVMILKMMLWQ